MAQPLSESEITPPPPPLKPLWQRRLGGLSFSSSSSISNPRKQQKPSSCPPPSQRPGTTKVMGKMQESEVWGTDLSIPLPKVHDKILEHTYIRMVALAGVGTLSCQPHAAEKGLNWQPGNHASSSLSTTSLRPISSSSGLTILVCKTGGAILQMKGIMLNNTDNWCVCFRHVPG